MKNIFKFIPPKNNTEFNIKKDKNVPIESFDKKKEIVKKIDENLKILKKLTHYNQNSDIEIREFEARINCNNYNAALLFYDGLVNSEVIDDFILKPLMSNKKCNENKNIKELLVQNILVQNQISYAKTYEEIVGSILSGNCVLIIDDMDIAISCDTKKLPQRSISKSENEMSTRGPNESFVEALRPNTGLIRKYVKDENLVFEDVEVGRKGKTICSIAYISTIANESLLAEVKRRVDSIDVDYLLDTGQLEQLIEDKTYISSPLILTTERPDKVASHLFEGRIAILVSGSPNALIVPATLTDFMHTTEDIYNRYPYSLFVRFFRIPAMFLAILLPGLYIATVLFHHEMIPTALLFSIAAAREKVPFPLLLELLIMELAFEIIREASIRTPAPIGPTLGIVGTLILGQAIVSASVVSPILIIVVALTGISSFAVGNFSLNYTFRILRFMYIFLGAIGGYLGISVGLFIHLCTISTATSFGVPYLSPFIPVSKKLFSSDLIDVPIWKQELRPKFLKPKVSRRQPKISRKWTSQ